MLGMMFVLQVFALLSFRALSPLLRFAFPGLHLAMQIPLDFLRLPRGRFRHVVETGRVQVFDSLVQVFKPFESLVRRTLMFLSFDPGLPPQFLGFVPEPIRLIGSACFLEFVRFAEQRFNLVQKDLPLVDLAPEFPFHSEFPFQFGRLVAEPLGLIKPARAFEFFGFAENRYQASTDTVAFLGLIIGTDRGE